MKQPRGFESSNPNLVCKLNKALSMALSKPQGNGLKGCKLLLFNSSSSLAGVIPLCSLIFHSIQKYSLKKY